MWRKKKKRKNSKKKKENERKKKGRKKEKKAKRQKERKKGEEGKRQKKKGREKEREIEKGGREEDVCFDNCSLEACSSLQVSSMISASLNSTDSSVLTETFSVTKKKYIPMDKYIFKQLNCFHMYSKIKFKNSTQSISLLFPFLLATTTCLRAFFLANSISFPISGKKKKKKELK